MFSSILASVNWGSVNQISRKTSSGSSLSYSRIILSYSIVSMSVSSDETILPVERAYRLISVSGKDVDSDKMYAGQWDDLLQIRRARSAFWYRVKRPRVK